jgi:hypothetical protein
MHTHTHKQTTGGSSATAAPNEDVVYISQPGKNSTVEIDLR